jgi:UDP-apiose/xylose synthase
MVKDIQSGQTIKTIAIFGAGGFIGSHIVKGILKDIPSFRTICVDLTNKKLNRIVGDKGYEFIHCDIREEQSKVETIIETVDVVIDLVAYANPHIYLQRPIDVVKLNLFDNLKIVDLCIKYNKYLVQFSTCEVYGKMGKNDRIFNEDDSDLILGPIRNHRWVYSSAKQLLERMVHAMGWEEHLDYTIIRPFNFIGPEMDFLVKEKPESHPRVFPHFMSALLHEKPLFLVDGGLNMRTFTYIDDAVSGILAILRNPEATNREIYNIGTPGNETTIKDFAILMKRSYENLSGKKSKSKIISIGSEEFYGKGYEDCDRRIPDVAKLSALGWSPKYDLPETVQRSIQYYVNMM